MWLSQEGQPLPATQLQNATRLGVCLVDFLKLKKERFLSLKDREAEGEGGLTARRRLTLSWG